MMLEDRESQPEQYESLFARDPEGRLIRIEQATRAMLERQVRLLVDGQSVTVPEAVPATDAQGNVLRDADGYVIPRLTTIYDAAAKLFQTEATPENPFREDKNPIPVLCHQDHLKPIGVCRVCSVLESRRGEAGTRLFPACQYPVRQDMEVHTVKSKSRLKFPGEQKPRRAGQHVLRAVRQLLSLLLSDHSPDLSRSDKYQNELQDLGARFRVRPLYRSAVLKSRGADDSSPIVQVDHNSCILCDRCVRSCSEVKPFKVIGHTGYGNRAKISFDLNQPMGESSCAACGECAISCPTGALTFKGTVYQYPDPVTGELRQRDPWDDWPDDLRPRTVSADELQRIPLFADLSYAFLKWNEGAVGRLEIPAAQAGTKRNKKSPPAQPICRKGDFGSAAFMIEQGALEVDFGADRPRVVRRNTLLGEMACLSGSTRAASLWPKQDEDCRVLVIRRNILHMVQRSRIGQVLLRDLYRERALKTFLDEGKMFEGLSSEQREQCLKILRELKSSDTLAPVGEAETVRDNTPCIDFLFAEPGQIVVQEGEMAWGMYFIHLGHAKVAWSAPGGEVTSDCLGPGRHFGEVALMSRLSDVVKAAAGGIVARRTATCSMLDRAELVRINVPAFQLMLDNVPGVRAILETACLAILGRQGKRPGARSTEEFLSQGLHQGQNLLVIDLHKCTRCQECVRACSDAHEGVTRLILTGERFLDYLVPSACRSCRDPVCLTGCPVDAIHRRPADPSRPSSLAIFIEDHCIGCGLCAHNCPFGSIHMLDVASPASGESRRIAATRKATNCDLCESLDGNPRCVYACPHDAAHRLDGFDLARSVGINILGAAK